MLKQPEKQGFSFEGMAQENPYDEGIFTPSLLPQLTKQAPKQQIAQPNYVPDPVYAMLSEIDPKIAKKHLEYQSLTDRLIDAAQAKAQIRLQNAAPKTMGKEESVAVALGEALAKLGGARSQYAEGFSQNYTQSRQQQFDRENQQNALRAVQDYEVQQAMAEADIFGLGEQRKLVTGELEGLYDERKQVYDVIIEQEKTTRALQVQEAMKDRQITVEEVRAANRAEIEDQKRRGATDEEIRRVEELTYAAYDRYKRDPAFAGFDDAMILAMASNLAWSEYDKTRVDVEGKQQQNDFNERTADDRARKIGADADRAEQAARLEELKVKYFPEEFQLKRDALQLRRDTLNQRIAESQKAGSPVTRGNQIKDLEALKKLVTEEHRQVEEELKALRDIRGTFQRVGMPVPQDIEDLYMDAITRQTDLQGELLDTTGKLKELRKKPQGPPQGPYDPVDPTMSGEFTIKR